MTTPLVHLDGVTCAYAGAPALANVTLALQPGAFVGVVGPSGSGKTTLLRCILGAVHPVAGSLWRARGLRVSYVPQVETINWNFPVTVAETVLMARVRGRRLPWPSAGERRDMEGLLQRLGIGGLAHRHIRELSGGQQQRVFLARALVSRPHLILLDEPTAGVDVRTRHDVLHLLADLNAEGPAVVLTTHDLNGIAAHLPHIVCLNTEVIGEGRPSDLLTPAVLERTYGSPMEVLEHGGMPVVVDHYDGDGNVVPLGGRG